MGPKWSLAVDAMLALASLGGIGWLFWRSLRRSHDPAKLIFKWLLTAVVVALELKIAMPEFARGGLEAVFGLVLTMIFSLAVNIIWRNSIIEIIAKPITSIFDGGEEPPEPKPVYSIALARRKQGRPLEAIVAIREQLAKFPEDFTGVLLLAGIQAEDMGDLPGAEMTLHHFCNSAPPAPQRQVVAAFTQLADWHLQLASDVDSARAALQQIIERFPQTEDALRADQRLAHFGQTEKILLARHDRQRLAVPEGVRNLGLLDSMEFLQPKEIEPGKLAAAHVKHLEQHPHDTEVREKLALIYAQDFKRLDLATAELRQLIDEPRHSPKQVTHWLNRLANLQVELGADVQTVRATLEEISERFPDSPAAEVVQRRLARLNLEFQGRQETANVKLGVYEQNLGLKYGPPRKH